MEMMIMAKSDEFAFLDATAQAEMVRRREVKAIGLVGRRWVGSARLCREPAMVGGLVGNRQ